MSPKSFFMDKIYIIVYQVLIEAGSASSFELSPHFANQMSRDQYRGSREQVSILYPHNMKIILEKPKQNFVEFFQSDLYF